MLAIQLIFDKYTPAVEAQLTRDLIAMRNYKPKEEFAVICTSDEVVSLLNAFNIPRYEKGTSSLTIVYKIGEFWPDHPSEQDTTVVMRDLYVSEEQIKLDPDPSNGYYLPPQGYTIKPQIDLSKRGPQGKGVVDPILLMVWGGGPMNPGIF